MRCEHCYPIQWCPCGKSLNRCKKVYHSDEYPWEVTFVDGKIEYRCEICYLNEWKESQKKKEQRPVV